MLKSTTLSPCVALPSHKKNVLGRSSGKFCRSYSLILIQKRVCSFSLTNSGLALVIESLLSLSQVFLLGFEDSL